MKLITICSIPLAMMAMTIARVQAQLNLTQSLLNMALVSGELSELVFSPNLNPTGKGYEFFRRFNVEPDAAIVAKKDGRCYGIFRATTLTLDDWRQNLDTTKNRVICSPVDRVNCCTAKKGFVDAYDNSFRSEFEANLRTCASTCSIPSDCVVLGGMSQGAAIADIASVFLTDLVPYVVLFGQPETFLPNCKVMNVSRHFNFINSGVGGRFFPKIAYDRVYMGDIPEAVHYGHIILLSDDATGIAYLGMNSPQTFESSKGSWFLAPHVFRKIRENGVPGYVDRLKNLISSYSSGNRPYPVRNNGFVSGTHCTKNVECEGSCQGTSPRTPGKCK